MWPKAAKYQKLLAKQKQAQQQQGQGQQQQRQQQQGDQGEQDDDAQEMEEGDEQQPATAAAPAAAGGDGKRGGSGDGKASLGEAASPSTLSTGDRPTGAGSAAAWAHDATVSLFQFPGAAATTPSNGLSLTRRLGLFRTPNPDLEGSR